MDTNRSIAIMIFIFVFTFSTFLYAADNFIYGNKLFYPHSLKWAIDHDASLPPKIFSAPRNLLTVIRSGRINAVDGVTQSTILHQVSRAGDLASINLLLKHGAEAQVNRVNRYGAAPLHEAIQSGSPSTVNRLIQAGADVNAKLYLKENHWLTPLSMAIELHEIEMVKLLLQHGALLHEVNSGYDKSLNSEVAYSALNLLVFYGHTDLIELLLDEKRLDVHARDSRGDTALHTLALSYHLDPEIQIEIARLLIEKGINIDSRNHHYGNQEYEYLNTQTGTVETQIVKSFEATPLHRVARYGSLELLDFLILKGADVNARTRNGFTPLMLAVARNENSYIALRYKTYSLQMVRSLLKAGADSTIKAPVSMPHHIISLIWTEKYLTPASLALWQLRLDIAALIKSYRLIRFCY